MGWHRLGVGLLLTSVLLLVASVFLQVHNSGMLPIFWVRQAVASPTPQRGFAYVASLEGVHIPSSTKSYPAQILENGLPLHMANSAPADIESNGRGRFRFWHNHVTFSTSDNSDPRLNHRSYEIYWPYPIPHRLIVTLRWLTPVLALLIVGLLSTTCRSWGARLCASPAHWASRWQRSRLNHPLPIAVGVFFVTLGIQLANYGLRATDPALAEETGMSILGTPHSDALSWDVCGESLAAGKGLIPYWSANRPGYAIFLATFYTWFGPSYTLAIVLNLIAAALTVALIYLIGDRTFGRAVGLCAAVCMSLDAALLSQALLTSTETIGLLLFVWSIHLLLAGVEKQSGFSLLASGILCGLSNLVRPLTLIVVPGNLLCLCFIQRRAGVSWRQCLRASAVFALGLTAALAPWLIRQKIEHDIVSISDNVAGALYAASHPRHGVWGTEIYREADADGIPRAIKPQYDYFMKRFQENLQEHTAFYIDNIATCCQESFLTSAKLSDLCRGMALVLLCASSCWHAPALSRKAQAQAAGFLALAGLAWWTCPAFVRLTFIALALLFFMIREKNYLGLIAVNSLCCTVLGLALFGFVAAQRFGIMMNWLFLMFHFVGVLMLTRLTLHFFAPATGSQGASSTSLAAPPAPAWLTRSLVAVGSALAVFLVLGGARLVYANYVTGAPALENLPPISATDVDELVSWVNSKRPGTLGAAELAELHRGYLGHGGLFIVRGRVRRHTYYFPPDVEVRHWSRYFKHRDYDRTIFYFRGRDCKMYAKQLVEGLIVMPGVMPEHVANGDMVLVGRISLNPKSPSDEVMIEGIAMIPWQAWTQRGGVDGVWSAENVDHLRRLTELRNKVDAAPSVAPETWAPPDSSE